jgi:hypothetical protein
MISETGPDTNSGATPLHHGEAGIAEMERPSHAWDNRAIVSGLAEWSSPSRERCPGELTGGGLFDKDRGFGSAGVCDGGVSAQNQPMVSRQINSIDLTRERTTNPDYITILNGRRNEGQPEDR